MHFTYFYFHVFYDSFQYLSIVLLGNGKTFMSPAVKYLTCNKLGKLAWQVDSCPLLLQSQNEIYQMQVKGQQTFSKHFLSVTLHITHQLTGKYHSMYNIKSYILLLVTAFRCLCELFPYICSPVYDRLTILTFMSPLVTNYFISNISYKGGDPKVSYVSWVYHDDIIKWKHFPRFWPFVRRIHRSPVNSSHKGHWRGALMLSLICVWINTRVNNREAGDLRCHRAHYNVTAMSYASLGHEQRYWNVTGRRTKFPF